MNKFKNILISAFLLTLASFQAMGQTDSVAVFSADSVIVSDALPLPDSLSRAEESVAVAVDSTLLKLEAELIEARDTIRVQEIKGRAFSLLLKGEYTECLNICDEAIFQDYDPEFRLIAAQCLEKQERFSEALTQYSDFLQAAAPEVNIMKDASRCAFLAGDYESAILWAEHILSIDESNADANYYKGMALYESDRKNDARPHLQQAHLARPDDVILTYKLAHTYLLTRGEFSAEAKALLEEAKTTLSRSEMSLSKILETEAIGYMNAKEWQKSLDTYTEAMALDPSSYQYLFQIAECHYNLGNYQESMDYYTKYLEYETPGTRAYKRGEQGRAFAQLELVNSASMD